MKIPKSVIDLILPLTLSPLLEVAANSFQGLGTGLIFHTSLGGIRWDLLVFTVPGVIMGGFWGARTGRYIEQRIIQKKHLDSSSHGEELAYQSPLKWTFAIIILVDGLSILTHPLLYSS